ncbi:hypothetical protein OH76DRAFT_512974 [Lentinus brumalis]|uniref:Uncharacterized protein n=1 Tax=Lentinus brumalis TaxID=2498619 RepID=A0A371DB95_9APHY|nr:hypothetical protein OH76DRAFT_512974 [Polyporus brumalis]
MSAPRSSARESSSRLLRSGRVSSRPTLATRTRTRTKTCDVGRALCAVHLAEAEWTRGGRWQGDVVCEFSLRCVFCRLRSAVWALHPDSSRRLDVCGIRRSTRCFGREYVVGRLAPVPSLYSSEDRVWNSGRWYLRGVATCSLCPGDLTGRERTSAERCVLQVQENVVVTTYGRGPRTRTLRSQAGIGRLSAAAPCRTLESQLPSRDAAAQWALGNCVFGGLGAVATHAKVLASRFQPTSVRWEEREREPTCRRCPAPCRDDGRTLVGQCGGVHGQMTHGTGK